MKLKWALLVGWMIASIAGPALANEHPKEHPTQGKAMEHPKQEKKAAASDARATFSQAVKAHAKQQSAKSKGLFFVHDEQLNKDWYLVLTRIHKEKIAQLDDGRLFACADFREAGEDNSMVDLDFYARDTGNGLKVEEVLIHKVGGKPRFSYDANNNRVPAGKGRAAKSGQGEAKATYACPMDGYKSDKPGKCPKCGMDLERSVQ